MPKYLKRDTIRLLESSVEAISLATMAIGLPQRHEFREVSSQYANAIGLAGVSAELAMSAIIVQIKGESYLRQPSGFYKTGGQIVDAFKELLNSKIPKMLFLTQGIDDPASHINCVLNSSVKFKLLTKSRAGGLHAGIGPSKDVCIACINEVIAFLQLLGCSSRIKPYIETIPYAIEIQKSYELIVEDLIGKLNTSTSATEKASILSSIFLVIPELPTEEPDWLSAYDRIMVSPKDSDISFLLDTLKCSKYASLVKVAKSEDSIPVTVQKGVEGALPIEPQYLKKSFSDIKDRVYADRGTANGRLDEGKLDPPPIDSAYEIFAFGLHTLKITEDESSQLTAVDIWPFVASCLAYSGTLGPYWYFVRKTSDWGQLDAYMSKADKAGGKRIEKGYKEFKGWFDSLKKNKAISVKDKTIRELLDYYDKAIEKKANSVAISTRYKEKTKELCEMAVLDLTDVMNEKMSIGNMLTKLVENKYIFTDNNSKQYWAKTLCEMASELEDTIGLLAVLKDADLYVAHTAARKALRVIDFVNYGPTTE